MEEEAEWKGWIFMGISGISLGFLDGIWGVCLAR